MHDRQKGFESENSVGIEWLLHLSLPWSYVQGEFYFELCKFYLMLVLDLKYLIAYAASSSIYF